MSGVAAASAPIAPFPLTVPLVLVAGVAIAWWSWNRSANPPRFSGYSVRIGWMVDPVAWLDRDLRRDLLAPGIYSVLQRLLRELTDHRQLRNAEIFGWLVSARVRRDPLLLRARRTARRLDGAYRLANLAEDPRWNDVWSRWRRPIRRARARQIFEEELREIDQIWPRLEAAA